MEGTPDFGLWYERSNDFILCTYIDVDYVESMNDRNSKSGEALFLGGRLIYWLRKKQDCISQSTTKLEYVATINNCNQIMWMK